MEDDAADSRGGRAVAVPAAARGCLAFRGGVGDPNTARPVAARGADKRDASAGDRCHVTRGRVGESTEPHMFGHGRTGRHPRGDACWLRQNPLPPPRVKKNRPAPVRKPRLPVKPVRTRSGLGRFQTVPNLKFKFEFKKIKNSQKIPKNTSRCDESNGVKFSQKFVHLV